MEMMLCPWESPRFLILSSNVPTLLYYSHFVAIFAALIFAVALGGRVREPGPARWLFISLLFFSAWAVLDVLLWAANRPDIVLFYWNLQILLEILLYASSFYFAYYFITKAELGFLGKAALAILILPVIALLPTSHVLQGIDVALCNAVETPFIIYYSYVFELGLALALLFIAFRGIRRDQNRSKEITFFMLGIIFFLLAFSSGNIIGSITDDWSLAQSGLFGMPVFIGFLAYSAVRFKTFNMKLFGAQALVIALWLLTLSQLVIRTIDNMRIIVLVNLAMFTVLGYFLIRSVRSEIEHRRQVERLAHDLQKSNEQQVILIHFITHQIKGFVTKSRNIFSMLLEGDYGSLPETMRSMVEEGFKSDTKGANTIQEILNAANIKSGKVTYAMAPFDFKQMTEEIIKDLKPAADTKELVLSFSASGDDFTVSGDRGQMVNAIKNLIDNSIKYTKKGSVTVTLAKEAGKLHFQIQDTGVGITSEDMAHLFTEGGHGKNSQLVNVESTGFGLYIVKNIVDAHHGKVWAESEGEGKGSRFIVELPVE